MYETVASAPGKVLLVGEYAVLERGNMALSVAIDRRIRATASDAKESSVLLDDFGRQSRLLLSGGKFSAEAGDPVFKFAVAAANAVVEYAGAEKVAPFMLRTRSDAGFNLHGGMKSGIGSSAAATVAMCAALLEHAGVQCSRKTIELVSQRAHYFAQGRIGSGFDVATSVYGTVAYRRFSPERVGGSMESLKKTGLDSHVEYASLPKGWRIVLGFSGMSARTVELGEKVNEFKKEHHSEYFSLMNQICIRNAVAIDALRRLCKDASDGMAERSFVSSLSETRELLRELGSKAGIDIEPEGAGKMLEAAMDAGAIFSKLPGAGGGDSALALCRDGPSALLVRRAWQGKGAYAFEAAEAKEGVRLS